ncbi:MAG TPA: ATP-dependent DNA helicase [Streptosporangiaceae bacterium]|nr:ATP-dependent DNA helicase [Streptosporangiaceae bacterium]
MPTGKKQRPAEAASPAIQDAGPEVAKLLAAAVEGIGGTERSGQVAMTQAVEQSIATGEHLAVQAGTGTGKSLAYLVPAVAHAMETSSSVVVATATIALQRQLIDRDLPRLTAALEPLLDRAPTFAILKGRGNYLCRYRLNGGAPEEPGETLFDPAAVSAVGRQVQRLHEWAADTETGDRDELVPGVEDRAWRQVAISAKECIGAARCPNGSECFAEQARERAGMVDIVVTNHALLAIDALEDFIVLPEHDVVIIDEAHDLVSRVTTAASRELSAPGAEAAARRTARILAGEGPKAGDVLDQLRVAAEGLGRVLPEVSPGRMDILTESLAAALTALRAAATSCAARVRAIGKEISDDAERLAQGRAALAALSDIADTSERILGAFGDDVAARPDVVWMDRAGADERQRPPTLHVAPLQVGGLLAERVFRRRTVVLTSATLAVGGSFEPLARQWGLPLGDQDDSQAAPDSPGHKGPATGNAAAGRPRDGQAGDGRARDGEAGTDAAGDGEAGSGTAGDGEAGSGTARDGASRDGAAGTDGTGGVAGKHGLAWSGRDVGSPFDHPRSGILYVARHLPPPGRDGLPPSYLTEIRELIDAAGGRTLGLFSSMRAARQATEELRDVLGHPLLCQGEDATAQLVRQFAEDEGTCLFGTLSLWQGVDVPGPALQLVVIDRIPFPRPDDPLASARQRAVAARGGNGFMTVAAAHAGLLLAQGAGRLLRTMEDKGMVAVLDPRLATARYSGFLRASLPPFWSTTDPDIARAALRRLSAARTP